MISARSALQYEEEIAMLKSRLDWESRDRTSAETLVYQIAGISLLIVGVMAYLWYDRHTEATELRQALIVAAAECGDE